MRMVKMQQETLTLEEAVQKFLMEKDAQHTGAAAMTDYRNCLARFVKSSHNSIEYDLLDLQSLVQSFLCVSCKGPGTRLFVKVYLVERL